MSPDEQAIADALDAATNAVASRIQNLLSQTPGLSAEFKAAMTKETDALTALGKSDGSGGVVTGV